MGTSRKGIFAENPALFGACVLDVLRCTCCEVKVIYKQTLTLGIFVDLMKVCARVNYRCDHAV